MERYHWVFTKSLDPKTNWYAFNNSLDGYQPNRNQEQNVNNFKKLAGDVRQSEACMKICLRQRWNSDSGARRSDVVALVASTFAVLTIALQGV